MNTIFKSHRMGYKQIESYTTNQRRWFSKMWAALKDVRT